MCVCVKASLSRIFPASTRTTGCISIVWRSTCKSHAHSPGQREWRPCTRRAPPRAFSPTWASTRRQARSPYPHSSWERERVLLVAPFFSLAQQPSADTAAEGRPGVGPETRRRSRRARCLQGPARRKVASRGALPSLAAVEDALPWLQ